MIGKWAIVILATAALLGAAVASAASISVGGADALGSGSATVLAPAGVQVTDVEWVLLPSNPLKVFEVKVTFAAILSTDDCRVTTSDGCEARYVLKETDGTVLAQSTDSGFELSTVSGAGLNTKIAFTFNGTGPLAADIDLFAVTVIDPE